MKNLSYCTFGLISTLIISFFLMGCVSEPVKINWPANHPANSETQEAEFIHPNNPFETDMAAMSEDPDKNSMMKHTMPKEGGMQHMDHNMGTDEKDHSESEQKMQPQHSQEHDQH